jgi:hypothetical protein
MAHAYGIPKSQLLRIPGLPVDLPLTGRWNPRLHTCHISQSVLGSTKTVITNETEL